MKDRIKNCIICGRFIPKKNYKYCSECHENYGNFKNKDYYWREKSIGIQPDGEREFLAIIHIRRDKMERRKQNEFR